MGSCWSTGREERDVESGAAGRKREPRLLNQSLLVGAKRLQQREGDRGGTCGHVPLPPNYAGKGTCRCRLAAKPSFPFACLLRIFYSQNRLVRLDILDDNVRRRLGPTKLFLG